MSFQEIYMQSKLSSVLAHLQGMYMRCVLDFPALPAQDGCDSALNLAPVVDDLSCSTPDIGMNNLNLKRSRPHCPAEGQDGANLELPSCSCWPAVSDSC